MWPREDSPPLAPEFKIRFLFASSSDRIRVVTFIGAHRAHSVMPRPSEGFADMDRWRWKAASLPPSLLPPPSISPRLDPVLSDTRRAALSYLRSTPATVNTSIPQELNVCRPRVTLNPRVGGLIPIIFLCTLLLCHCHSIVLDHCGQGRPPRPSSRSLSFFYQRLFISRVKAGEGMHVHPSFLYCLLRSDDFCLKWICCSRLEISKSVCGWSRVSVTDLSRTWAILSNGRQNTFGK